jgi:hypothetical protein
LLLVFSQSCLNFILGEILGSFLKILGGFLHFFQPEKYDFDTYKGFLWKIGPNCLDFTNLFLGPDFYNMFQ